MLVGSERTRRRNLALLGAAAVMGAAGCHRGADEPAQTTASSPDYRSAVSAFFSGVIALDTSDNAGALANLTKAAQLAPDEPAAWADLGLLALRQNDMDGAAKYLQKAEALAPDNSAIAMIHAGLEARRGALKEASDRLRKAAQADPKNVKLGYGLAHLLEQQGDRAGALAELKGLLGLRPDNLFLLLASARSAAEAGDGALVKSSLDALAGRGALLRAPERARLQDLRTAATGDPRTLSGRIAILRNVLSPLPAFKRDYSAVAVTDAEIAPAVQRLLKLPNPSSEPAAPDTSLTFRREIVESAATAKASAAHAVELAPDFPAELARKFSKPPAAEAAPVILSVGGTALHLARGGSMSSATTMPFPGAEAHAAPDQVLSVDFSYDFRPDLVLAGEKGLRLLQQMPAGGFSDVTSRSKLPSMLLGAAYRGAWAVDLESDGDLDILLAPEKGSPFVLRNNADGTWSPQWPFSGVSDLRGFAWADLDADGIGDAAVLDAKGQLHVFENQRGGHFQPWSPPLPTLPRVLAVAAADLTRRGGLDLVLLEEDGSIVRVGRDDGAEWTVAPVASWPDCPKDGSARLLIADLDNNGADDVIGSGFGGSRVWLGGPGKSWVALGAPLPERITSVDLTPASGRVDLVGVTSEGAPVRLVNAGTKSYHWQKLRPRADFVSVSRAGQPEGDMRINAFGVGGEIECRAGLLYQRVAMSGPTVHMGLGESSAADAVRIFWPNGYSQGEFPPELKPDQATISPQRLGGSCPWLFAWDGTKMKLVTDCIWRSPLGLKINAQATAGASQTQDWIRIRGDQLAPREGFYTMSICAELWETHLFDYLELVAVDHPAGSEVFVDERFVFPQPPLKLYYTSALQPVARALDDQGNDVTAVVAARDDKFLGTFERGPYQGIARPHSVEVELPAGAPANKRLFLVATGWVHPTDSSINVAISQGQHDAPQGISLETQDRGGKWRTVRSGQGFPEGKIKTVLLDLNGLFAPGAPRRVRLHTNLEVYWDYIGWASEMPNLPHREAAIPLAGATLRYRGFSQASQADPSAPELGDYDKLSGSAPRWLDLEGFYTRFGEVGPLLKGIDDRYVIMNAGDELALRWPVQSGPAPGWVRDYVLKGAGWVKDGNFNTQWCKTVAPLPIHAKIDYPEPPGALDNDLAYRKHPEDWSQYHTRYVWPGQFEAAMRSH